MSIAHQYWYRYDGIAGLCLNNCAVDALPRVNSFNGVPPMNAQFLSFYFRVLLEVIPESFSF